MSALLRQLERDIPKLYEITGLKRQAARAPTTPALPAGKVEAVLRGEVERLEALQSVLASFEHQRDELARTQADLAQARSAAPAPEVQPAPPAPATQKITATPHYDGAGLMRGLILESPLQRLNVRIQRDGADEPIALHIEPDERA